MPVPSSPYLFQSDYFSIRWYGVLIALGIAIALFVGLRQARRSGLNEEYMLDAVLLGIPIGVLGARIYYVLFHWDYYGIHLNEIIRIWEGGLAIHGGIIAGIVAAYFYFRYRKTNILPYLDLAMPCMALAQAIGRWGNWFNQEAFGSITTLPWGMLIDGEYRHPTFLYESIWDILLFVFLYALLRKKKQQNGVVTAWYLILYSVGRFWIEQLRTDSEWLGPFKAAQVFSVIMIILGILILLWVKKQKSLSLDAKQNPIGRDP
ncbi:MAG TPA: prolipoprotein diacylglyceryl transferase [Bacillota bacterium]|nr:prolipoprotein diacylglyceryl transferase [Bacillota bacterium]